MNIFCIQCPDAPNERIENVKTQQLKVPDLKITILDCVTKQDVQNRNIQGNEAMMPSKIACFLSHMKVYMTVMTHSSYSEKPYTLILEDDFNFVNDFQSQLDEYMSYIQDHNIEFDMFMLSPFHDSDEFRQSNDEHIYKDMYRYKSPAQFFSTAGYIINNNNLLRLSQSLTVDFMKAQPIDIYMFQQINEGNLNVLYVNPRLITTEDYVTTLT